MKFTSLFALVILLSLGMTSCIIVSKEDNGGHRGWYKNSNNPHHPLSTNPGHGHGRGKH